MRTLLRLSQIAGANAVPVVGVLFAGWSDGTALALYWSETALLIIFIAARIAIHQRMTGLQGHYPVVEVLRGRGRKPSQPKRTTFLLAFLGPALVFSIAHLIFLVVVLSFTRQTVSVPALRQGFLYIALFVAAGFITDVIGIQRRPFAWIRRIAEDVQTRLVMLQITLMIGITAAMLLGLPRATLIVFALLKGISEFTSQLPTMELTGPPRWMAGGLGRVGFDGFESKWRQAQAQLAAQHAEDERPRKH